MKIEARQRLAAQSIVKQPISNAAGKHYCRLYTELSRTKWNSLGIKEGLELGWFMKVYGPLYCLRKADTGEVVAYAELNTATNMGLKGYYVAALFVTTEYRGKGLATVLHLGCLHVLKRLTSDETMAMGALSAFKSLTKYGYTVRLFDTSNKKFVRFTWGADKIPVINGKSMQDYDEYFVFHVGS